MQTKTDQDATGPVARLRMPTAMLTSSYIDQSQPITAEQLQPTPNQGTIRWQKPSFSGGPSPKICSIVAMLLLEENLADPEILVLLPCKLRLTALEDHPVYVPGAGVHRAMSTEPTYLAIDQRTAMGAVIPAGNLPLLAAIHIHGILGIGGLEGQTLRTLLWCGVAVQVLAEVPV